MVCEREKNKIAMNISPRERERERDSKRDRDRRPSYVDHIIDLLTRYMPNPSYNSPTYDSGEHVYTMY